MWRESILSQKVPDIDGPERQFRDDGDAVITLLPVQRDVLIAEPLETLQREASSIHGFLQPQHVQARRFPEFGDDVDVRRTELIFQVVRERRMRVM